MQDNTINKIKYKIRKITEYPLVEIQDQIAIRPPKQKISPVVYQTWIDNKFGKTHAKSILKFRELNKQNKLFGHCYHATQALYYFFVDAKLKIMSASCEGPAEHHWWLQDVDNNILDVTAEQYDAFDFDPPYQKGKESKWYGWKNRPHRKTQKLMNKIQPESKLYFQQYLDRPKKVY